MSSFNVEYIVFRHTLTRGLLSFHDFMQYASTSKERRLAENGIYRKMIDFLCREFNLNQLPGFLCPPFREWPIRYKALWLWFYIPDSGVGFETKEIEQAFYSSKKGQLTHWNNLFKHLALYLAVKWRLRYGFIPDHMLIAAYQREIGPRFDPNIWVQFLDCILNAETIEELRNDLELLFMEMPWERLQKRDIPDLAVLNQLTEHCTFEPARVLFKRYVLGHPDSFIAMRQLYLYEKWSARELWWKVWAHRLDVACALDMATPGNDEGFRIKVIVRAVFDSETNELGQNFYTYKYHPETFSSEYVSDRGHEHFWRTLEKAGLITIENIRTLYDHVDRNVVADLLPLQWRHEEPWSTLIDTYMSKRRRRHRDSGKK